MISENDIMDTLSIYASLVVYSTFIMNYALFLMSLGKSHTLSTLKVIDFILFLECVPTILTLSQDFEWPKNGYRVFIILALWGVATGLTGVFFLIIEGCSFTLFPSSACQFGAHCLYVRHGFYSEVDEGNRVKLVISYKLKAF